jgi:putative transposase
MAYPSDLKTEEWQLIEKFFEPTDKRGNQSKHTKQHVVNAIMYVVRTGVQWRYLPQDFPRGKRFMTITVSGINEVLGITHSKR